MNNRWGQNNRALYMVNGELNLLDPRCYYPVTQELILPFMDLTDSDITKWVVPFLNAHQEIKILRAQYNKIGDEGACGLAQTNLKILSLKYNKIGDKGAYALAFMPTLEGIDLDNNHVGEEGFNALRMNSKLARDSYEAEIQQLRREKSVLANENKQLKEKLKESEMNLELQRGFNPGLNPSGFFKF